MAKWSGRLGQWFRGIKGDDKDASSEKYARALFGLALLKNAELVTEIEEVAAVSAIMAIKGIAEQVRSVGGPVDGPWTLEQMTSAAGRTLEIREALRALETLKLVSRDPKTAVYLEKLTTLAFEKAVAALHGSTILDNDAAIKNLNSRGAWTLVKSGGDKQTAEVVAGLAVALVSTKVIAKIAEMTPSR